MEVLDVDDLEARQLLVSIDPLALLADYDNTVLDHLRAVTASDNATLEAMWANLRTQDQATLDTLAKAAKTQPAPRDQFLVLIECATEDEQVALLARFQNEGLKCKALIS